MREVGLRPRTLDPRPVPVRHLDSDKHADHHGAKIHANRGPFLLADGAMTWRSNMGFSWRRWRPMHSLGYRYRDRSFAACAINVSSLFSASNGNAVTRTASRFVSGLRASSCTMSARSDSPPA